VGFGEDVAPTFRSARRENEQDADLKVGATGGRKESDKLINHLRRLDGSILILVNGFFEHFRKQPRLDKIFLDRVLMLSFRRGSRGPFLPGLRFFLSRGSHDQSS
jgi:hypothetical protein